MELPILPNIEQRASDDFDILKELFDEQVEENGVLIDSDLEQSITILEYAGYLAGVLTDYADNEQVMVAYRSIHFIHLIHLITALTGCNKGMSFERVASLPKEVDDAREAIRCATDEYIEHNPTVAGMTDAYMPELDPSGLHGYLAETVVGFVGMQIQDALPASFAADMIASWDGIIPDDL